MGTVSGQHVRKGWRARWAAVGAAVAVSLGAGGFFIADAASGPESSIVMTDPVRILDTRDPVDLGLSGPFVSPTAQKLQVTGSIPTSTGTQTVVPEGATGVLLNVTAVGATADGFISIRPGDATGSPTTSSLNVTAGVTVPNSVQVALPTTGTNKGKIDITWDALGIAGPTTDILIDVVGYTSTTALDAKANSADVYTRAEIDAANALQPVHMYVSVASNGNIFSSIASPGVSTAKTGTGTYEITFPVSVIRCTAVASDAIFATNRDASADTSAGANDEVVVEVRDTDNSPVDTFFDLQVVCPGSGVPAPLAAGDSGLKQD